jgi:hypothetical protein
MLVVHWDIHILLYHQNNSKYRMGYLNFMNTKFKLYFTPLTIQRGFFLHQEYDITFLLSRHKSNRHMWIKINPVKYKYRLKKIISNFYQKNLVI